MSGGSRMCPSQSIISASVRVSVFIDYLRCSLQLGPNAMILKHPDWIYRRSRSTLQNERCHVEHEFVPLVLCAGLGEPVQIGVIDQMNAHEDQRPDVNRKSNSVDATRSGIARTVRAQHRYLAFV